MGDDTNRALSVAAAGRLFDLIDPRRDRPRSLARLGVAACVAVTVVLGGAYAAVAVGDLTADARENATENYDDREFGGGNALVVDKGALYEARALVPEDGSYRIVTGPLVEGAPELTEPYIDEFARSFLMPRRPTPDAPWVLCYGCDPSELEGLEVVWTNDAGISFGRLPE